VHFILGDGEGCEYAFEFHEVLIQSGWICKSVSRLPSARIFDLALMTRNDFRFPAHRMALFAALRNAELPVREGTADAMDEDAWP
jgi:hypothetical protein